MKRSWMILTALILLTVCAGCGAETGRQGQEESMDLLAINVGKADCLLLQYGGLTYMIDTGTEESWGAVSAALKLNGVTRLDGVIVTHTDKDHAGGAWALATSSIPVGGWYASAYYCEVTEEKHPVAAAAALRGGSVTWLKAGDALPFGNGKLTVLGPTAPDMAKENNNSVVLYAEACGGSILLAGDMEFPEETLLLQAGLVPKADVLKVGNHGESDATSAEFIAAVSPKIAVISTNSVEEPDTPAKRVLKLLKRAGAQVALTENAPGGVLVSVSGGTASCRLVSWRQAPEIVAGVTITAKDAKADTVTLTNTSGDAVDLSGWFIRSERGGDTFVLPQGTVLAAGESLTVGSLTTERTVDLTWPEKNVWHNSKDDAAYLFDVYGREISRLD